MPDILVTVRKHGDENIGVIQEVLSVCVLLIKLSYPSLFDQLILASHRHLLLVHCF